MPGHSLQPGHSEYTQAELDAQAARLRGERDFTFQQIADEQGCSVSTARARVLRTYGRMAGPKAAERRQRELADLEDLETVAWRVLETNHVLAQVGKVVMVTLPDGTEVPIADHQPTLDAMDRIVRIKTLRAQFEGTFAARKHQVDVITRDVFAQAFENGLREMADLEAEDEEHDDADAGVR